MDSKKSGENANREAGTRQGGVKPRFADPNNVFAYPKNIRIKSRIFTIIRRTSFKMDLFSFLIIDLHPYLYYILPESDFGW
ncbi:hypothetical protein FH587_20045 [Leptospira interrogans]|uniref:hypothetical protein n=1 Tax=Leptospira interrogans TaxID=173 RepID=UPI001F0881D3|nr:hypothetical protein [Leptospira interrogans]UML84266.1 hypothetical protein FH587_19965 [Leptospira interrogans]UML84282.1 hypothetical protein FH587_20045 [Leptospira interrogans]